MEKKCVECPENSCPKKQFDESAYVEAEIIPLVEELRRKCVARKIPMITLACKSREDGVDTCLKTCVFPEGRTPQAYRDIIEFVEDSGIEVGPGQSPLAALISAILK